MNLRTNDSLPEQYQQNRTEYDAIDDKDAGRIATQIRDQKPDRRVSDNCGDDSCDKQRGEAVSG